MKNWHDYPPEHDAAVHTVVGRLLVREKVHSPELHNERDIYVYLPPSYETGEHRYPVLYMHDGQNLFDQALAYSGEWQVDETMEAAAAEGLEAVVVGIPNMGGERCDEYSPFVDPKVAGGGCAKPYMQFVVETLKPLIDRDFRTLPDRVHTGMVGSSMGGLASVYGLFRHPETFGFIGAMSPSLWVDERSILEYVSRATKVMGKIYLDIGTGEGEAHVQNIRHLRDLLLSQGYVLGRDLLYVEDEGAGHEEAAWARRFRQVLSFFMAPTQAAATF